MKRDVLEQPFEAALVKKRRGAFGKELSYVEGVEYVRRLNEAFDARWSFEIVEYQIHEAEVIVLCKLIADDVIKTAFGGSAITAHSQTGEAISLADDLKAAATDALKKASSLMGIGLYLYRDHIVGSPPPEQTTSVSRPVSRQTSRRRVNGHRTEPLTSSQLKAIHAIARSRYIPPADLRRRTEEAFGVPPEELTKTDASSMIDDLRRIPPSKQQGTP